MIVKTAFTHRYGAGHSVEVPAGARLVRNCLEGGYWVDPTIFPRDSLDRFDAEHYGIRVAAENAAPYSEPPKQGDDH